MRLITIQSIKVVEYLRYNEIYHADINNRIGSNLIKPYKFMMNHYGYKHRPIFTCIVGYNCNFSGCKTEDSCIIEMEVPEKYCKVQDYYGWSDFIYFTELPNEFEEFNGIKTVEQFGRYVLDMCNNKDNINMDLCYQATIPSIHRSWVKKIIPFSKRFYDKYIDNGGRNVLRSII